MIKILSCLKLEMVSQFIKAGTILGGALGGYWCYVYYKHHGFRWAMIPVFLMPVGIGIGADTVYHYSPQIMNGFNANLNTGWTKLSEIKAKLL